MTYVYDWGLECVVGEEDLITLNRRVGHVDIEYACRFSRCGREASSPSTLRESSAPFPSVLVDRCQYAVNSL